GRFAAAHQIIRDHGGGLAETVAANAAEPARDAGFEPFTTAEVQAVVDRLLAGRDERVVEGATALHRLALGTVTYDGLVVLERQRSELGPLAGHQSSVAALEVFLGWPGDQVPEEAASAVADLLSWLADDTMVQLPGPGGAEDYVPMPVG